MKLKALFRIIIWAVISVLLASVFALALAGQLTNLSRRLGVISYDDSDYKVGDGTVTDFGSITGIDIEWVAGTVNISKNTVEDEIQISESAAKEFGDWQCLRYKVEDGILYIKYTAPKSFEVWKTVPSKQLSLKIPGSLLINLETVNISSTSANVSMNYLKSKQIAVDSVSGKTELNSCTADVFKAKSVSGNIVITLPQNNNGFELEHKTVAGKLNTRLDLVNEVQGFYRYKNGESKYYIDSEVGYVEIK